MGAYPVSYDARRTSLLGDAASMLIPQWHLVVFPGAAIVIAVLAFNQFGDGLRDALDPRLRGTNL